MDALMVARLDEWWDRSVKRFENETGATYGPDMTKAQTTRLADILEEEARDGLRS